MKRLLSALVLLSLLLALAVPASAAETVDDKAMRLERVILMIENSGLDWKGDDILRTSLNWLFERDPASYDLLLDFLLSRYDSHSTYLPAGTYDEAFPSDENYIGIGVTLTGSAEGAVISDVREGTPAARAGLMRGDLVAAIDGTDVLGRSAAEVSAVTRGESGTPVTVTVLRAGVRMSFKTERGEVEVPNLTYEDMGGGLWYMKIERFSDAYTYMLFAQARQEMKDGGVKALILDLRGNPGGQIRMALTFADHLIDRDGVKYFTLRSREDDHNMLDDNFYTSGSDLSFDKIVVLTDSETASGAEILASALHDTGYAVTVGETTYGKARGQNHLVFDDGSAAILTTVQLIPPSGVDYEGVGLKPDIEVARGASPHPAASCRRLTCKRIGLGQRGQDVQDLLAALKAMGLLADDYQTDVFDEAMLGAVNRFRNTVGENPMTYVNAATVNLINARLDDLSRLRSGGDEQLDKAVEVARSHIRP